MISMNLSDIAIQNIQCVDYRCMVGGMKKAEHYKILY